MVWPDDSQDAWRQFFLTAKEHHHKNSLNQNTYHSDEKKTNNLNISLKEKVLTKRALVMMTNNVLYLKPTWSYKIPATDGPTKDPRANVDVHNPDTRP